MSDDRNGNDPDQADAKENCDGKGSQNMVRPKSQPIEESTFPGIQITYRGMVAARRPNCSPSPKGLMLGPETAAYRGARLAVAVG